MVRSPGLTFLLLLLTTIPSLGQRQTVSQSVQWFATSVNLDFSKRYSLLLEGQFRYVNGFEPMQFQARTGLDVTVNKHFSFMPVGYVYSWNPIYGHQPAAFSNNEHRIFEQVAFRHNVGLFRFDHRIRLEQRFIQVHENNNGEVISKGYSLYLNRFRYRFQLLAPINNKTITAGTIYACLSEEIFVDFGKSVIYTDPDQNRIFAGLGYQVNKQLNVRGGYFTQMLIKLNAKQQENNTGFQIQLLYKVDLANQSE